MIEIISRFIKRETTRNHYDPITTQQESSRDLPETHQQQIRTHKETIRNWPESRDSVWCLVDSDWILVVREKI